MVWVGALLWAVAEPEPARVPLRYTTGTTGQADAARAGAPAGLQVKLALLEEASRRHADEAFVTPKNIFAALGSGGDGESAAPRTAPAEPLETIYVPVVPLGPTPEELAAEAARQELTQFRYLGYLSRNGRDEAFLSKGQELHIVRTGQLIEQRILVKAITPTGVILQESRSQVEQTILPAGAN